MYQESHGILQNNMYDPTLKRMLTQSSPTTAEWFEDGIEPIWTTNQRASSERRSAAEWFGANVVFGNETITYVPYNSSAPSERLVDEFIDLFTATHEPINFGAVYFDEPDNTGHLYGPDSIEMHDKLAEIDNLLGYLIKRLEDNHLLDKLNLIVTSDHGMAASSSNLSVFLNQTVDVSLFDAHGANTIKNIFLKNRKFLNRSILE